MPRWMDRLSATEGAMSGVLAGSVLGGPVGALIGAGVGLLQGATRRNELDLRAAEAQLSADTERALAESLALAGSSFTNPLDRDQLQVMGHEIASLRRATLSSDADTRARAQQGLQSMFSVIGDEMERVQQRTYGTVDYERDRLNGLADATRANFEGALAAAQSAEATGASIHEILASDLPTDSPLFAGSIISLLQQSQRNMMVDPYGTMEYTQDTLGQIPVIGGALAGWIGGKAELAENQFSREQFRQIADAFLTSGKRAQEGAMQQAVQRGQMLDQAAQRIGYDPAVRFEDQIRTGRVENVGAIGGPGQYQDVGLPGSEPAPAGAGRPAPGGPNPYGGIVDAAKGIWTDATTGSGTPGRAGDVYGQPFERVSEFVERYATPLLQPAPQEQAPPPLRGRIDRTPRGNNRRFNR